MRPTEKSFNQVKAILGKLDRNIDALREQKRSPVTSAPAAGSAAVGGGLGGAGLGGNGLIGGGNPAAGAAAAGPAVNRPSSPFGRATPIPPKDE